MSKNTAFPAVVDRDQRLQALDPSRSFCVTAPAGSGKTEILIQRFLRLLSRVEKPEEILAITFTRKAAAEMRERILQALADASDQRPCREPHHQQTRSLADAVLVADSRYDWNLQNNSTRLRIMTIDSFCAAITRQMPILSSFGSQPTVADDALPYYRQASREMLKLLETSHAVARDIATLLDCFNNDWQKLESLLEQMLARRDQWLMHMGIKDDPEAAQQLIHKTLEQLIEDQLQQVLACLGSLAIELTELVNISVGNLRQSTPDSELVLGGEFDSFPTANISDLNHWRQACSLLMTADGKSWRKTLDKRQGFPPEEKANKQRLLALIRELAQTEGSLALFQLLKLLPDAKLDDEEWRLITALSHVLPILAAQLFVVFQQHGAVDYSQISMSALDALGSEQEPTELGLKYDYKIRHILVDEFQDTAINQYRLLERLTSGWQEYNAATPSAPNTLFIVGDGMQSIYGFRDANVGLFVQAQQYGINGISLENLHLQTNFRSDRQIVDWVNASFATAFPTEANIERGDIDFRPATAHRQSSSAKSVTLKGFCGETARQMEADYICELVADAVADQHCESVAILVRSRSHLAEILPRLSDAGISWLAHDIDPLVQRSAIVDLLSLCRAVLNPADRIAWLSVLRSPLVGLGLQDLHQLAAGPDGRGRKQAIPWRIMQTEICEPLSEEGGLRISRLQQILSAAQKDRERKELRVWIESIWLALGGPGSLSKDSERDDVLVFFGLLEEMQQQSVDFSSEVLQRRVEKLFANGSTDSNCKVHVMTIHKAKGLEFDRVILPALGRKPAANDKPLLLWQEYSNDRGFNGLLLAAKADAEPGKRSLYNYLGKDKERRTEIETTRLLYVAATRAAKQLYLTTELQYDEKREDYKAPVARSLLKPIWPVFQNEATCMLDESSAAEDQFSENPVPQELPGTLKRPLPDWTLPALPKGLELDLFRGGELENTGAQLNRLKPETNKDARSIGTVVHLTLENLAGLPLSQLENFAVESYTDIWSASLLQLGVSRSRLTSLLPMIENALKPMLEDETGRWILSSARESAVCEFAVSHRQTNGQCSQLILDRSFIYEGERWIIDYKTSSPGADESLEDFLDRQAREYRPQLQIYKAAMLGLESTPIRTALYFTAIARLHELDQNAGRTELEQS